MSCSSFFHRPLCMSRHTRNLMFSDNCTMSSRHEQPHLDIDKCQIPRNSLWGVDDSHVDLLNATSNGDSVQVLALMSNSLGSWCCSLKWFRAKNSLFGFRGGGVTPWFSEAGQSSSISGWPREGVNPAGKRGIRRLRSTQLQTYMAALVF